MKLNKKWLIILIVIIAPFLGASFGYTYNYFSEKSKLKNFPEQARECLSKIKSSTLEPNKNYEPGVISLQFKDEALMESINNILEKYNLTARGKGWDYLEELKWIVIKVPEGTEMYWGCTLESLPEVAYADLSLIVGVNLPTRYLNPPMSLPLIKANLITKVVDKAKDLFSTIKKSFTSIKAEKGITFKIYEWRPTSLDNIPKLLLYVSNKSLYDCRGYKIAYDFDDMNRRIKISLDEINNINDCLATLNTTGLSEELNLPEGEYTLEFQSKKVTDEYLIKVSKAEVKIEPIKTTFSETSSFEIKRVSNNLYLAECFGIGDWRLFNPNDNYCQKFFTEIDKISEPQFTPENGKIIKKQTYKYNGNAENLLRLKNKYSKEDYIVNINRIYPSEAIIEYDEYHPKNISECKQSRVGLSITNCLQRIAYYTKDKEVCQLIDGKRDKETCYFYATGINKDDIKSCNSSENPEKCYKNIFYIYQDPELCRGVGNQNDRYYCYFYYAQVTNDKSFCEPVWILNDDLRKKCEAMLK